MPRKASLVARRSAPRFAKLPSARRPSLAPAQVDNARALIERGEFPVPLRARCMSESPRSTVPWRTMTAVNFPPF